MQITKEQQTKGEKLYQELVAKAWEDATFKEQLISNPKEAIGSFSKKAMVLPEGMNVVVEDQSDVDTIYFNIPRQVDVDNLELSDEQLEMVSGGELPVAVFLTYVAVGATIGATAGLLANKYL